MLLNASKNLINFLFSAGLYSKSRSFMDFKSLLILEFSFKLANKFEVMNSSLIKNLFKSIISLKS